jgi:uncharacterized repeat protein (TIGR03803 family)
MRSKNVPFVLTAALVFAALIMANTRAAGQTEMLLHSFSGLDGFFPDARLTADASGNFYGTTYEGGTNDTGTVFELSPQAGGGWTEKVLYSFGPNGSGDGLGPTAAVILDAAGNLYGTTAYGGAGGGIVFELTPQANGSWTEKILHSFGLPGDGHTIFAGLIFDSAGNLYGTAGGGGSGTHCSSSSTPCGMVFELSPQADGSWKETILHNFGSSSTDGQTPFSGLTFDAAGRLYGTTAYGGAHGDGTVFQLRPLTGGGWTESLLYSFCAQTNCADGSVPISPLIFDAAGSLYSTTAYGGGTSCYQGQGCGTVFKLSPAAGGRWTEKVLHAINRADGFAPDSGVIFDKAGNLYGTTSRGTPAGAGAVFELSPVGGGGWTSRVLHTFTNAGMDGASPEGGLTLDAAGNLYGTTFHGGTGFGTVYKITP